VKSELRALNLGNQKRKCNDHGTLSKSVSQKKPIIGPTQSHLTPSTKQCGRTNRTTTECHVGTNKCI